MDNRARREDINRELLAEIIAATHETIQEALEFIKAAKAAGSQSAEREQ